MSAGGGIFNYYNAIVPHLKIRVGFVDVGKPQHFYSSRGRLSARFTPLRLIWDWLVLAFKIMRFRPDLVHMNPGLDITTFRSLRRDAVNVWIARFFGRPVLVFWRGWNNAWCGHAEFPGGNSGFLCRTYQRADAHIVLAKAFEQDLRRWGFRTPIFLETTVAPEDIVERSPAGRSGRSRPVRLLFLSRVEIEKGVFELLDAFLLLQERAPGEFALTVAGDGPGLERLRCEATERGAGNVCFPGMVGGEERIRCYLEASIFCFLSYTEGMPNAVLEAMAMGLPLVSSDAGGLKDILKDGETGFIVPQNGSAPDRLRFSPSQIADQIQRLARDPDLYERIADHNRRHARERFSAPAVARRLEHIYHSFMPRAMKACPKAADVALL